MELNQELMSNPDKAFEIAKGLNKRIRNNIDNYMFLYATPTQKNVYSGWLVFKDINTRQSLHIAY
tara:strand:+ start:278 stop:472 length:195 start_codon:yes stop_codon:yes gene_type:complete